MRHAWLAALPQGGRMKWPSGNKAMPMAGLAGSDIGR
jgi:hypothetical protein